MTIKTYVYSKRLRSTGQPAASVTQDMFTAYLKDPVDVIRPTFKISKTNWEGNGWNYISAVLGDKERYYRVESVIHDTNDIYEVSCVEDVLATWRANIKASTQYVLRSDDSSLYNLSVTDMITDMQYPAVAGITTVKDVHSNIFDTTGGYYVLGVIFDGVTSNLQRGPVKYVVMNSSQIDILIQKINNLTWTQADLNPIDYIVSCTYIPITFSAGGFTPAISTWDIGPYSIGSVAYYYETTPNSDGVERVALEYLTLGQNSVASTRGKCYNYEPWTSHHLYAGPFGDFDLPPSLFSSGTVSLEIAIDQCTGEGRLEIYEGSRPIITLNAQLGVPVMLTQQTSSSLRDQYEIGTHLASSLASAASFNFGRSASEMGAAIMTSYAASIPKVSSMGSVGSMASMYEDDIILVSIFRTPTNEALSVFGRPVMAWTSLSGVTTGKYIKTQDARLAIPGYDSEIREIESLMDSGIYLD